MPRPAALEALLEQGERFAVAASCQVTSTGPDTADTEPYVVAAMVRNGKPEPFRCPGWTSGCTRSTW